MFVEIVGACNFTAMQTPLANLLIAGPVARNVSIVAASIKKASNLDELINTITSIAGFFSIIVDRPEKLLLITDRIRSVPIFYSVEGQKLRVSLSHQALKGSKDKRHVTQDAIKQFMHSGFTTGNSTLDADIYQVEAGEILEISKTSSHSFSSWPYAKLNYPKGRDQNVSFEALDKVVTDCFRRLIDVANGRQIVLPLSGGFDSRLCAIKLRELGYDNLLAFSYGFRGNKEANFSRFVAEKLKIPWEFSEYNSELLIREWNSPDRIKYREFASNGCSLPHYQDYFAIKDLRERGCIENTAIVVPGHSADFNAGSHLPPFVFTGENMSRRIIKHHLIEKHFSLWRLKPGDHRNFCNTLNLDSLPESVSCVEAAEFLDNFNMSERQAKFIVNACRAYGFFDLDWWLPFWDEKFVKFWCNVPLEYKKDRWWYKEYVRLRSDGIGLPSMPNASDSPGKSIVRRVLLKLGVADFVRQRSVSTLWKDHPLNPFDVLGQDFTSQCVKQGARINGCYTLNFLKETGYNMVHRD